MKRALLSSLLLSVALLWACGSDDEPTDVVETSDEAELDAVDEAEQEVIDPCTNVEQCDAEGPRCVGSKLEVCSKDPNGCVVVSRTVDCSLAEYGDCAPDAEGGANCVVRSPCDGITNCSVLGSSCDGDAVLTCALDTQGCRVESREDCSQYGTSCVLEGLEARCGFDPCSQVSNPCETPSRVCNEGTLEVCAPNVYGCLVKKEYPCQALGGSCDDSGAVAACLVPGACQHITPCIGEGNACEGSELVRCQRNEYGCLAETRANCTQTEVGFGYCDGGRSTPVCNVTFNTSCDQFTTCSAVDRRCEEDVLVDCSVNGFACLVETRTDCAALGQVCHVSGTVVDCVDPCSLVATCNADVECSGNVLVNCALDENNCLVPTEYKDCAGLGQVCNPDLEPPACDIPPIIDLSVSPNLPINDDNDAISTISVTQPCSKIDAITVSVDIQHSWIGDITVSLKSPAGSTVILHNKTGSSNDDIVGVYPTTLQPHQSLDAFLGQTGTGSWTMTVSDGYSSDDGVLQSWGLHLVCS
jgi:subtilisin-like proprotein convertase family protein